MPTKEKMRPGEIPKKIMQYIMDRLRGIQFGEIALVAHDGMLMKVECLDKLYVQQKEEAEGRASRSPQQEARIRQRIAEEFARLAYGRLSIAIKQGEISQLARTEKYQFTGLDGEGI